MNKNPIRMMFTPPGFLEARTDAVEFTFPPRLKRVERWLRRWLAARGWTKYHFDRSFNPNASVMSICIDTELVVGRIVELAAFQIARMHCRPTKVLMGQKEFQKILSQPEMPKIWYDFSFHCDLGKATGEERYRMPYTTTFGLTVHVIPWMEGVLVL